MGKVKRVVFITLMAIMIFAVPVSAATKTLSKTDKKVTLTTGNKYTLKIKGASVTWVKKENGVLSITKKGVLTPKKAGRAKIAYALNGKKKNITVIIKKASGGSSSKNSKTDTKTTMVYLPATGKKYHRIPNCGTMNPSKARRVSLSEAQCSGYTACTNCW